MKAKQIVVLLLIVLVACTLSALVAYRYGLRRWARASSPAAASVGSRASAMAGCVDVRDAGAHMGETSCVSGRLLRVFTSRGGNTFLDFCEHYHKCPYTSIIFATDKSKFGDLGTLAGRQVEIEGKIMSYQVRPETIIKDPRQIHLLP